MAHQENGETHLDAEEASGGSKEGVVRWVLGIGLLLAIFFLSLIWIIPALSQGDVEEEITASGNITSASNEDAQDTDSIVSEDADEFGETGSPDPLVQENEAAPEAPATAS